jgi:hypothetical protein
VRSTFASSVGNPIGLAFDSAGNLFESNYSGQKIYEFTPGGMLSTFASVSTPAFLAFQPVPEPSLLGLLAIGATVLLIRRPKQ